MPPKMLAQNHAQHEALINMLYLFTSEVANTPTENLRPVLPSLVKIIKAVKAHFASEEEMFDKTDYFDVVGHKIVHLRFVFILEKLYHAAFINPRILRGSAEVLSNSIINHIEVEESLFNKMMLLPTLK